jgi:hypothetical protein
VRILISYEDSHRVYGDALERTLRGLRPGAEVAACSIGSLGRRVGSFEPDLVVSSRANTVDPGGRAAWYKLSPGPDEPSEACLGGRRRQRLNPTLEDLLSLIDEVEALVLRERDPIGC